jgi:hypothetical protein
VKQSKRATVTTASTRADDEAFTRAIAMARRERPDAAQEVDDRLAREGWRKTGESAAYGQQCRTLSLKPWEWPPCWIGDEDLRAARSPGPDDHSHWRAAAKLVEELIKNGLSRFEPDPIRALERVKAERAA